MTNLTHPSGPVQGTTPVRFSDPLPKEVDVVIIGAGVVGMFSALYLNRCGLKVAVLEKGRVGCEQSSRNWGWIRQTGRDLAELPIMMDANHLWGEVDAQTKGRTGFKRGGVCYLASSDGKLAAREAWLDIARQCQLDTRMLSKAEVDNLIKRADSPNAHQWKGGLYTPNDARAEPWQAIPAIAELAQFEGVSIIEDCAARMADVEAGAIKGVVTEKGTISCKQVVLAGGAWSSLFARNHGIQMPQLSVRSTVCATVALPEIFSGNVADETLAFRRREDGGYNLAGGGLHDLYIGPDAFRHFFKYLPVMKEHLPETSFKFSAPKGFPDAWNTPRKWEADDISPFERMRVLDPEPKQAQVRAIRKNFAKRFPEIGEPEIKLSWAGMIDTMPDIIPIVDRAPSLHGLIIATGMSGHGFGIGPGFGKIVSEIAMGNTTAYDMSRFRFNRFSDGSKVVPGPGI